MLSLRLVSPAMTWTYYIAFIVIAETFRLLMLLTTIECQFFGNLDLNGRARDDNGAWWVDIAQSIIASFRRGC